MDLENKRIMKKIGRMHNYWSYFLTTQYYENDKTLDLISEKFVFTFPISISMKKFFNEIIIPLKRFIEITKTHDLIAKAIRINLEMYYHRDYDILYNDKVTGNFGKVDKKVYTIDFRYYNKNIITLFHELTHLVDYINDKFIIKTELLILNSLDEYDKRPHEIIALAYSIEIYKHLYKEFREKPSFNIDKAEECIVRLIMDNVVYFTMNKYDYNLDFSFIKRLDKAYHCISKNNPIF